MAASRSTYRATKLSEFSRTETASDWLNEPYKLDATAFQRYRTQEVAGSSPASSTLEVAASREIWSRRAIA
jgi:hypothetical protein